jgi:hypothetical protein
MSVPKESTHRSVIEFCWSRRSALLLVTTVVVAAALLLVAVALADAEPGVAPRIVLDGRNMLTATRASSAASTLQVTDTYTTFLPLVMRSYADVRPWPNTTSTISVFNDQLATEGMNEAQFQFAATHYAGSQKQLRDDTRHLRQYNPNFLVLHYRLGQALGHSTPNGACQPTGSYLSIINGNEWVQEWPGEASVQESWFFHSGSPGSRVFQCTYGHYLMELNDSGWRDWWSTQVIQQLQNNENDGVFADSYSVANYLGPWNPPLPPLDTSFESEWAAREHSFTDFIRGRFAGRWKWIPNVGAYITTRDPSDYSNVDGAMIEGFAEWGGNNYFDVGDWELQMNRILPLVAADKILIAQTYPNESDVNERLFVLGSYLLIKGKHTYINLETSMMPEWFPEYTVDLGAPTDALPASISTYLDPTWNVYVRHYAKGMALVNPTDTSRTVNLGATYYRVVPSGGGEVPASGVAPGSLSYLTMTSVTLDAHQAMILLNQTP